MHSSIFSVCVKIALFVAQKRAIFSFSKVATDLILSPAWRQIAPSGHPADMWLVAIVLDNAGLLLSRLRQKCSWFLCALQATLEKVQTVLKYPGPTAENATIREDDKTTWKFEEKWSSGSNILGLIVAALVRYNDVIWGWPFDFSYWSWNLRTRRLQNNNNKGKKSI